MEYFCCLNCKGLFTPIKSWSESEKDQRNSEKDKMVDDKNKKNPFRIYFRWI